MSNTQHCGNGSTPLQGPDLFEKVDENVRAELPENSTVVAIFHYPKPDSENKLKLAFQHFTGQIRVIENGTEKKYFLKVAKGDTGRAIVRGEFESNTLLHSTVPGFVPKPYAWGTYKSFPEYHFFLSEELFPEPLWGRYETALTKALANLHEKESPSGKYGYPTSFHLGLSTNDSVMCKTWVEFFQKDMQRLIAHDRKVNGEDAIWGDLGFVLCDSVIPWLLSPLTNSESILPVLVHGNLYNEVCGFKKDSGEAIVFEAAAFWAPKEYDYALRRFEMKFDRSYIENMLSGTGSYSDIDAVHSSYAQFLSRLKLYHIHSYLHYSILYGPKSSHREKCIRNATKLVQHYGAVFNGF